MIAGLICYFASYFIIYLDLPFDHIALLYMALTSIGYILILTGGNYISRTLFRKKQTDIFNRLNASFPQEERKLQNAYSINLPAQYQLAGDEARKKLDQYHNFFPGNLLILGSPRIGQNLLPYPTYDQTTDPKRVQYAGLRLQIRRPLQDRLQLLPKAIQNSLSQGSLPFFFFFFFFSTISTSTT